MHEDHNPDSAPVLVIGFGNELHGDDGVGQCVARAVSEWRLPNVRTLAVHQLTPELAEPLANVRSAIFVDARLGLADELTLCVPIEPDGAGTNLGHTSDPCWLLALAQLVYGRHPKTWLVTVPAVNFDLGEGLSAPAVRGMAAALRHLACLVGRAAEVLKHPASSEDNHDVPENPVAR
jgi:hydrogenase maturation protease